MLSGGSDGDSAEGRDFLDGNPEGTACMLGHDAGFCAVVLCEKGIADRDGKHRKIHTDHQPGQTFQYRLAGRGRQGYFRKIRDGSVDVAAGLYGYPAGTQDEADGNDQPGKPGFL